MNESFAPSGSASADQFRHLAVRHLEGSLTAEEFSQFDQMLAENAACRSELITFALQARLIASHLVTMPELAPQTTAIPSAGLPVSPSPRPLVLSLPKGRFALSPVTWSILAASLLFAAYFVVISWDMLGKQLASSPDHLSPLAPDKERGHAVSEAELAGGEGDTVATIRDESDAQWSRLTPASTRGEGAAIAPGQPLSIQSGLVELQLKQGTTLLIEGPADWKITGNNSATLTHGKLFAKVPQQAIGFTLKTPTAKIVDLGTEFGVQVSKSSVTEVHVLRGTVETQSRRGDKQPLQLRAGQSARIAAGEFHVESIPFAESAFNRLRARDSMEKASDEPVLLFADNFDSPESVADISPTATSRHLRQSGVLRGLSYIERRLDKRPNTPLDDRTSLVAGEPSGRLRVAAKRKSTVTVSPNANFRAEHRDGTRFVVECDVHPVDFTDGGEHQTSDSWAGVIVGCPSQMSLVGEPGGISLLIRRDGRYTVFDGTAGKATVAVSGALPAESVAANRTFQIRMEYELARFGGPKPVEVRIDINDVKVAQFTSQRSLLENFIVLQSYTADLPISSDFDNLSISEQELPVRESVNSKQIVD